MAEQPNGTPHGPDPETYRCTIQWAGIGSADFTVRLGEHVSPVQLYGLAFFIDQLAREVRMGDLQKQAMGKLGVSPASLLDQLRLAGRM